MCYNIYSNISQDFVVVRRVKAGCGYELDSKPINLCTVTKPCIKVLLLCTIFNLIPEVVNNVCKVSSEAFLCVISSECSFFLPMLKLD